MRRIRIRKFSMVPVWMHLYCRTWHSTSQYLSCVKNNSMKNMYFLAKVDAEFWAVAHTPSDHISMPPACLHDDCTVGLATKLDKPLKCEFALVSYLSRIIWFTDVKKMRKAVWEIEATEANEVLWKLKHQHLLFVLRELFRIIHIVKKNCCQVSQE